MCRTPRHGLNQKAACRIQTSALSNVQLRVYGNAAECARSRSLRDWLYRIGKGYIYTECAADSTTPRLQLGDDTLATNCTPETLAPHCGVSTQPSRVYYDMVVIGGGPAGLSAAIHGAVEGLTVLVVEKYACGGQITSSHAIENYAGYADGASGVKIAQDMRSQALRLGAEVIELREVVHVDKNVAGGYALTLSGGDVEVIAGAVVIATGARYKPLGLISPGIQYGMTEADALDAGKSGKPVMVIGAGNSAGQAALRLADAGVQVILLNRGGALHGNMSEYLIRRIEARHAKIIVVNNATLVRYSDGAAQVTGRSIPFYVKHIFVFAGQQPTPGFDTIERDADTKIAVDMRLETRMPNIFAVGDVRQGGTARVAAATADGMIAAREIHRRLKDAVRFTHSERKAA